MRMLCFQFTVVHRNSNMVREVDLLTRYNKFAQEFRGGSTQSQNTTVATITSKYNNPIGCSNIPLTFVGPPLAPRTASAKRWGKDVTMVLGTAGIGKVEHAITGNGHQPVVTMAVEPNPALRELAQHRLGQSVYDSTEEMLGYVHQLRGESITIDIYFASCDCTSSKETVDWLANHLNTVASLAEVRELKYRCSFFSTITPQNRLKPSNNSTVCSNTRDGRQLYGN